MRFSVCRFPGSYTLDRPLLRKPQLCVGPEECACIPGYTGAPSCDVPTCAQTCEHGGSCGAPDTCTCSDGWFGPNCTVPVCSQTCGNGGNCTAPGTCTCASEWSGGGGAVAAAVAVEGGEEGDDCRVPVCDTACLNGGWCVAPGTCACPPQWTGQDCGLPVCTQVSLKGVVRGLGNTKEAWVPTNDEFQKLQVHLEFSFCPSRANPAVGWVDMCPSSRKALLRTCAFLSVPARWDPSKASPSHRLFSIAPARNARRGLCFSKACCRRR